MTHCCLVHAVSFQLKSLMFLSFSATISYKWEVIVLRILSASSCAMLSSETDKWMYHIALGSGRNHRNKEHGALFNFRRQFIQQDRVRTQIFLFLIYTTAVQAEGWIQHIHTHIHTHFSKNGNSERAGVKLDSRKTVPTKWSGTAQEWLESS